MSFVLYLFSRIATVNSDPFVVRNDNASAFSTFESPRIRILICFLIMSLVGGCIYLVRRTSLDIRPSKRLPTVRSFVLHF